jgi:3-deoxy-manno-octulosonate cytidylyltransferase (CMP-KDO synthetase)
MQVVAIIPARLASTRLAAKLLKDLAGKSVLERTYEQACKAKLISEVIIATDSEDIYKHAKSFGARVEMTSPDHNSGSDRIAELAHKNQSWDLIVNVQGDEPFINPSDIDKAIEPFIHDPLLEMTSLYHQIKDESELNNPNNVKVVTDLNGFALYFSRSVIPFNRAAASLQAPSNDTQYKKHIGLYAYRRETLLKLTRLKQSELEKQEKLEQLRALENGIEIKMLEVNSAPIGIDTEEDYQRALSTINSTKI